VKKTFLSILAVLFVFSLLAAGNADAQDKKKGKSTKEMELVIADVGPATIEYQYQRGGKGRIRKAYIGVGDDTKIQKKAGDAWQDIAIGDLKKRDKVTVKVERDPEEAGLLALTVRVTGKGELLSDKKKKKKKK
jgi:hypothetical protein